MEDIIHKETDKKTQLNLKEHALEQQLKSLCDENGKERNVKQSAKIIHELGRVYRQRSPEKISLIRSAVLLNAAVVREPENRDEVETDLRELCVHVLELANARNKKADLLLTSNSIYEHVREMRKVVDNTIKTFDYIEDEVFGEKYLKEVENKTKQVKQLQEYVANTYSSIMKKIMDFCIDVIGIPPCKYSLAAMGSLARKEITPYSDFESIIVLEEGVQFSDQYENSLEYFRWVALLFQFILVGFKETVIYDAAIPSLPWFHDDFTPSGLSPDGFYPHASHNPLGRQDLTEKKPWKTELIKPVSEMLKYLEEEEDLKNGYHLADILTTSSFVCGSKEVYEEFSAGVREKSKLQASGFSKQTVDDLTRYGLWRSVQPLFWNDSFNVKRTIYRSVAMFVAALDQLCEHKSESPFDAIDNLGHLLPREFRSKLAYAVAIACEVRLKTYMSVQRREDEKRSGEHVDNQYRSSLVDMLGHRSAVDFMIIVCHLHGYIAKLIDEFHSKNESTPKTSSISLGPNTWKTGFEGWDFVFPRKLFLFEYTEQINAELCMMDFNQETLEKLYPEKKIMEYYHLRATVNTYLGQYEEALSDYHKTFSFQSPVPGHIKYFAWLTAKQICSAAFPDDENLTKKADILMPNKMLSVFGEDLRQLVLQSRQEAPKVVLLADFYKKEKLEKKFKTLRALLESLFVKLGCAGKDWMENVLTSFFDWKENTEKDARVSVNALEVLDTYTKIFAKNTSNPNGTSNVSENSDSAFDEKEQRNKYQDNEDFIKQFRELEKSLGCAPVNLDKASDEQVQKVKMLVSGFLHSMLGLSNIFSQKQTNFETMNKDLEEQMKWPGFLQWFQSIGPQVSTPTVRELVEDCNRKNDKNIRGNDCAEMVADDLD